MLLNGKLKNQFLVFMIRRLNFFLRNYIGFSKKESRGFVLVIPLMMVLYFIPSAYEKLIDRNREGVWIGYQDKADSMVKAGWVPNLSWRQEDKENLKADTTKKQSSPSRNRNVGFNKLSFSDADSVLLQVVPGIGPAMASRLVKFRENAGGLYEKEQLLDVYGMTPELMDRVFDYFVFSPVINRKLPINGSDVATLATHPYINYGAAKVIVAYREQHGPFEKAEDLLKIKIFNEDWVQRLAPYLEF